MKRKKCNTCKQEKLLHEFSFRNDSNTYRLICKTCRNLKQKTYVSINKDIIQQKKITYYQNFPWLNTFRAIKQRCDNPNDIGYKYYGGRGIKCLITSEELKTLWFRDKAYLMKKPSIDRIDNDGNYTYENCEYMELVENSVKNKRKQVFQYSLNNQFIKTWPSVKQVSLTYQCSKSSIRDALKGRSKTSVGFIWKYNYER